jgi:hypothetical protein
VLIEARLKQLEQNPHNLSLRTHKVAYSKSLQSDVYSIRVTGDLRILWCYSKDNPSMVILYDIGGHDEVY